MARYFTEEASAEAVNDRMGEEISPRLAEVMGCLVKHLHAFAKEVDLTQEEWEFGIDFLTRTGQLCSGERQEFILLSDTLGFSMLVDAINNRRPAGATESTVFGPFHVWSDNADGFYDVQQPEQQPQWNNRGIFFTGEDGAYSFVGIKPVSYPIPDDGPVGKMLDALGRHPYRPAHMHFLVTAPGYQKLVTHTFVEGDPYLSSDAVFGVKQSLLASFERTAGEVPWRSRFDFVLNPSGE